MDLKKIATKHKNTFAAIIIMIMATAVLYAVYPKDSYTVEVKGFREGWPMGSDRLETIKNMYAPYVEFQYNGTNYSTNRDSHSALFVDTESMAVEALVANTKGGITFQKAFPEENQIIYALATPLKVYYATDTIAPARLPYSTIVDYNNGRFRVLYEPDLVLATILWMIITTGIYTLWRMATFKPKSCCDT